MYIEEGYVNCTQMEGSRKWGKGEVHRETSHPNSFTMLINW